MNRLSFRARPRAIALLSVLIAVVALAAPAGAANDAGKEPAGPTRVGTAGDVQDRASAERAARLTELVERRAGLGVYVDQATSGLVAVVPVSGPGSDLSARELASQGLSARIQRVNISRDTVEGVNKAIEGRAFHAAAGQYAYGSHLDLQRGVMVVETDAPAEVVEGLRASFPGAVEVVQAEAGRLTRRSDSTPHWGGSSITNFSATCTSGFSVQNGSGTRFMVTAAHCFTLGTNVYSPDSPYYYWGSITNRGPFPAWDMELIGNGSYGSYIYTGALGVNTSKKQLGAGDPVVGFNNYCHSGQTSGEGCGHTVTGLYGQFCDASGCTYGLITYTGGTSLRPGDSGSPFYVYAGDNSGIYARGLNIAVAGSTNYAEKWSNIASHFGVTIVT